MNHSSHRIRNLFSFLILIHLLITLFFAISLPSDNKQVTKMDFHNISQYSKGKIVSNITYDRIIDFTFTTFAPDGFYNQSVLITSGFDINGVFEIINSTVYFGNETEYSAIELFIAKDGNLTIDQGSILTKAEDAVGTYQITASEGSILTIRNSFIEYIGTEQSSTNNGLQVSSSSFIFENSSLKNVKTGILIQSSNNVFIQNSLFDNISRGILITDTNSAIIQENIFINNINGLTIAISFNITIIKNIFENHDGTGVFARDSFKLNISSNLFNNNSLGIEVKSSSNISVIHNDFNKNRVTQLFMYNTHNLTVTNNSAQGSGSSIGFQIQNSTNNNFLANNLSFFNRAMDIDNSYKIIYTKNKIIGAEVAFFINNSENITVNKNILNSNSIEFSLENDKRIYLLENHILANKKAILYVTYDIGCVFQNNFVSDFQIVIDFEYPSMSINIIVTLNDFSNYTTFIWPNELTNVRFEYNYYSQEKLFDHNGDGIGDLPLFFDPSPLVYSQNNYKIDNTGNIVLKSLYTNQLEPTEDKILFATGLAPLIAYYGIFLFIILSLVIISILEF